MSSSKIYPIGKSKTYTKEDAKELRKARVTTARQNRNLLRAIETGNEKDQRDIVDWANKKIEIDKGHEEDCERDCKGVKCAAKAACCLGTAVGCIACAACGMGRKKTKKKGKKKKGKKKKKKTKGGRKRKRRTRRRKSRRTKRRRTRNRK